MPVEPAPTINMEAGFEVAMIREEFSKKEAEKHGASAIAVAQTYSTDVFK